MKHILRILRMGNSKPISVKCTFTKSTSICDLLCQALWGDNDQGIVTAHFVAPAHIVTPKRQNVHQFTAHYVAPERARERDELCAYNVTLRLVYSQCITSGVP